ncbi:MAG: hypothetical protein KDA28_04250, partial [Phycisphaerales bacterium]|nr:hypothetical protein [Phycisphaerales bacterium]
MGIAFAIDELYASGWTVLNSSDCAMDEDGRVYPTLERVEREFSDAGCTLSVKHIQLFDCYRAEWRDAQGQTGAVVGHSEVEASVYALSQLRR